MRLKVVLYGYYRGIISSRRIAEACCRNVVFMAHSADSRPHFTTIANFVSSLEHEIASLFDDVLSLPPNWALSARNTLPSQQAQCGNRTHATQV